ncbi:MAG TPA: ergothioneine biosynthesis protein EgtB [Marinagarivorans sp.]
MVIAGRKVDQVTVQDKDAGRGVQCQTKLDEYRRVRQQTLDLVAPLSEEDMVVQSMPDASPAKWHLAHTTWFFETFILQVYQTGFRHFNPAFNHLFNSYYESVGARHARPQRGLLTRPSLNEVLAYRQYIDDCIATFLQKLQENDDDVMADVLSLLTIGIHHEMQHQELISTDILHLLWHNPLKPVIYPAPAVTSNAGADSARPLQMLEFEGGIVSVGQNDKASDFCYDCETPAHQVILQPYRIANRLVTNGEWLEFMADGGYSNSRLWLSDGWTTVNKHHWRAPLYWLKEGEQWWQYGLDGLRPVDGAAPVCHVSFYEADAFARWAGKRLPLEHEWEVAARQQPIAGNFLDNKTYRPQAAHDAPEAAQLYGDVWQWMQSPFTPYPGFKTQRGALGEYNGKFMSNQMVLRGGSCVTPKQQLRASYRNFFYPHHRWQFSGLRLAEYQ